MVKKENYDPTKHKPINKHGIETVDYFLSLGKQLKIDSNYHIYFGNKWLAEGAPIDYKH